MNNKIIYTLLLIICYAFANAQDVKELSLQQVIELAKEQSVGSKKAKSNAVTKYWQYRNYKAGFKPQLALNGTLPDFTRSILPTPQNDGSIAFRTRSLANSSLAMSLTQNIGLTNSQLFVSSDIERLDLFSPTTSVNYLTNPAVVGIRQTLFGFNSYKWDTKIEPLKYEESKRQYAEEIEAVSVQATQLYFNLLLAQISHDIQMKNVANNDTLFRISKGRYNLGKIAENELLQMELNVMNANSSLTQTDLDVQLGEMQLSTFLRLPAKQKFTLKAPPLIPEFNVDVNTALNEAKKNRQTVIGIERQRMEAERDLKRAVGESGLNVNVTASYGLTQSHALLNEAYANPQSTQRASVGFSVPIFDWGKAKSQIKTAYANKEMVEVTSEQDLQNFEQEIYILVKQIEMYRMKLKIAYKSDTIAQKRYDLTMKRYMIGKISITDLNTALQEKDNAKRGFIEALRTFWNAYYELRRKTLYDFEKGEAIKYEYKN